MWNNSGSLKNYNKEKNSFSCIRLSLLISMHLILQQVLHYKQLPGSPQCNFIEVNGTYTRDKFGIHWEA